MRKLLFTRRFAGGTYCFYECDSGTNRTYYAVDTPANAFGYPDTVLFTADGAPYTMWRYLPPWILRECKQAFIKKGVQI